MENRDESCLIGSRRKRERRRRGDGPVWSLWASSSSWLVAILISSSSSSSSSFPLRYSYGVSHAFIRLDDSRPSRTRPRSDQYPIGKNRRCKEASPFTATATPVSRFHTKGEEEDVDDNRKYYSTIISTSYLGSSPPPMMSVSKTATTATSRPLDGLSQMHQALFSRVDRQRFVTGRFPLTVTVRENPTRHWLGLGRGGTHESSSSLSSSLAETEILVNGTTPTRSLASLDRFHWLDDDERDQLRNKYSMVSLELLAEIHTERPGYVHIMSQAGAGASAILLSSTTAMARAQQRAMQSSESSTKSASRDDAIREDWCRDRLWVTGFSLAGRRGLIKSIDADFAHFNSIGEFSASCVKWPNEVQVVPDNLLRPLHEGKDNKRDALLICDGFLVPGKDRGGIYVVLNPGNKNAESIRCLTDGSGAPRESRTASLSSSNNNNGQDRWFYHRASWVDLTGDNRLSILTARCQVSLVGNSAAAASSDTSTFFTASGISKFGELVWLECPKGPASLKREEGEASRLTSDGEAFDPFHQPWETHVLAKGPDVMYCVADLDPTDDTIEVIASEFFNRRLTLHSIRRGPKPRIVFSRVLDEHCGAAFGCILADLDRPSRAADPKPKSHPPTVVNQGSTVISLNPGDPFSHVLVTSHECTYAEAAQGKEVHGIASSRGGSSSSSIDEVDSVGGSLFAYRVPRGKNAWKTQRWLRTTVSTGFKVRGSLGNMINPGAPGFVYTFHAQKSDQTSMKRPMIAVAGDCAESAYIYRPAHAEECTGPPEAVLDPSTRYKLMVEFECGATVGSIGVGYRDFGEAQPDPSVNYARLYVPCFEKDKVLVFGIGNGDEEYLT